LNGVFMGSWIQVVNPWYMLKWRSNMVKRVGGPYKRLIISEQVHPVWFFFTLFVFLEKRRESKNGKFLQKYFTDFLLRLKSRKLELKSIPKVLFSFKFENIFLYFFCLNSSCFIWQLHWYYLTKVLWQVNLFFVDFL